MTAAHYAKNRDRFPSPRDAFADLLATQGSSFPLDPHHPAEQGRQLVPSAHERSDQIHGTSS